MKWIPKKTKRNSIHLRKIQSVAKSRMVRSSSAHARLTAWAYYSFLFGQLRDKHRALKMALRNVLPKEQLGALSWDRQFDRWIKFNLWPPPELEDTPYGENTIYQDSKSQYQDL